MKFRRFFSIGQSLIDPSQFSDCLSQEEWNLFHNHLSCNNCSLGVQIHKNDIPIAPKFRQATHSEFEAGLDEFFSATKPKSDSFEESENRRGLKPIPQELLKHLSSEYGKIQKLAQSSET